MVKPHCTLGQNQHCLIGSVRNTIKKKHCLKVQRYRAFFALSYCLIVQAIYYYHTLHLFLVSLSSIFYSMKSVCSIVALGCEGC